MNRIDARIRPVNWERARLVMGRFGGQVTVRPVETFGRGRSKREVYRGSAYCLDVSPELELTVLVDDDRLEGALAALESMDREAELLVSSVESLASSKPERRGLSDIGPAKISHGLPEGNLPPSTSARRA